jgi:hypothetical protein
MAGKKYTVDIGWPPKLTTDQLPWPTYPPKLAAEQLTARDINLPDSEKKDINERLVRILKEENPQLSNEQIWEVVQHANNILDYKLGGVGTATAQDIQFHQQHKNLAHSAYQSLKLQRAHAEAKHRIRSTLDQVPYLKLLNDVFTWLQKGDYKLEKPQGNAWHKLMTAFAQSKVKVCRNEDNTSAKSTQELFFNTAVLRGDAYKKAQVFVVEHNWGGLFTGEDLESEFKLPGEENAFDFVINGRRVIFTCNEDWCEMFVRSDQEDIWFLMISDRTSSFARRQNELDDLAQFILRQIKAISISLESEVATTEVVRAPHKLNAKREKQGKLPIRDYHIVSLARRTRPERLLTPSNPGERNSPRLHFRRGHWVHYPNHKTWRKWTLVGDPDLGFIDKHYRL